MLRRAGMLGLLLAGAAVPAQATEWLTCADPSVPLEVNLLMGGDDGLGPSALTIGIASKFFTTSPAYGEGTAITVTQSYFGPDFALVDIRDGDGNKTVARLRVVSADDGSGDLVRGGVFELFGTGAWPITCDL